MNYLNLILLTLCLVTAVSVVFILGKRLGSFSIPAVAATVSVIVALSLHGVHLGNAAIEALLATIIVVISIAIFVKFESKFRNC